MLGRIVGVGGPTGDERRSVARQDCEDVDPGILLRPEQTRTASGLSKAR